MEPFRPVIDYYLLTHIDAIYGSDIRKELVELSKSRFLPNGLTIPAVMNDIAQSIGMRFEGSKRAVNIPYFHLGEALET
jgi:hypothetical protein